MKVERLRRFLPLQNSLRGYHQIPEMVERVLDGGFDPLFDKIQITHLTDYDYFMVHDGHHRATAYILANKDLPEDIYQINEYTKSDYQEINLQNNWTTPLCPLSYARRCDLTVWRRMISEMRMRGSTDEEIELFIRWNRSLFCVGRSIHTMESFANEYRGLVEWNN